MFAFCALSGAVYAFNDVRDADMDRLHPVKRTRPIASGELSERQALWSSALLAMAALAGCLVLDWRLALFATIYLLQNIAYSLKLKEIAFVDVGLIASGFLLRVLAGAAAIDVPASGWVLICTGLLAIFLGLGKRAHELSLAKRMNSRSTTRAALAGYRIEIVRTAMLVLAAITCAAFVAYTRNDQTIEAFGTDRLVYSAPLVACGVVRFLFLALWSPKDESPTDAMLHDPWFLLALFGAATAMLYAIYG
jgi:4-hydroxybenzoate polyprenyltransferase